MAGRAWLLSGQQVVHDSLERQPMKRRDFISRAIAAGVGWYSGQLLAATEYDLLVTGGRVIDPATGTDALLDIAIRGNSIAAVAPDIAAGSAAATIDATGLLVVPGLIDVHVHARDAALPPAEFLASGVTTMVDAGSRGALNIPHIVDIARHAPNRLRMLMNVGVLGNNPGPNGRSEFLDGIEAADVEKGREAVRLYREWIVGIKARLSRGVSAERDLQVLQRAIEVATPFDLPVMIHIGDTAHPLPEILALLRPGDIVTHMYAPTPNGILDAEGQLLPQVVAARQNGIRFDFGNGLNEHWRWDIAEQAARQGFLPDTISSDLNLPGRAAQVYDLPNVLSKFLQLGMSLPEVIARATSNAAATFREFDGLGTLAPGAVADITLLELADGEFEFTDNYQGSRMGNQRLFTRGVVVGGRQVV
jgi:dihydroorotase